MKKLLAILILLTAGAFVPAQEAVQTEDAEEPVGDIIQKLERSAGSVEEKKDDKNQLTSAQKSRLIRKKLSKQKKFLKQKQKRETLIEINRRHLEYKQKQLEEFLGEDNADTSKDNEEVKSQDNSKEKSNNTEEKELKK